MNKMATHDDAPLTIEPEHELKFTGPFNRPVVTLMNLKNNSPLTLVFKIKTTAPKRYCVRPNIGKILPFKTTQVEICLQPFMYDQHEKNKHKFMVQSVLAPQDADLTDLNKLWKELEPDLLMDAKLKCVFEMPNSDANAENSSATAGGVSAGSYGGGGDSVGGGGVTTIMSGEAQVKTDAPKLLSSEEKQSNLPDATDHGESLMIENKQLRESNSELRKENLHMKEQIMRLRCSPASKQVNELYKPRPADKQIPIFFIAIAIFAAVLGLLLGKFLL